MKMRRTSGGSLDEFSELDEGVDRACPSRPFELANEARDIEASFVELEQGSTYQCTIGSHSYSRSIRAMDVKNGFLALGLVLVASGAPLS